MPINLVDLGVIYRIAEQDGLVEGDGVREVHINVVWNPPWTVARVSEAGRDALESWGLAV